jgi:LPXTG-site transpeptidase (sortase) family protein
MKINQKQKELIKIYIVLFAIIVATMNWSHVSWMFNYRELAGLTQDFFYPQQDSKVLAESSVSKISDSTTVPTQTQKAFYSQEDSLEIPAIGLTTSVVRGQTTDVAALEKNLDKGAVVYPGSVNPGKDGQMIILGHSAPPGWPHIKHDWVFTDINNLKTGDEITLYSDHARYVYRVINKEIIHKGQDITIGNITDRNILTLISCWPPGKDQDRITVSAEYVPGG